MEESNELSIRERALKSAEELEKKEEELTAAKLAKEEKQKDDEFLAVLEKVEKECGFSCSWSREGEVYAVKMGEVSLNYASRYTTNTLPYMPCQYSWALEECCPKCGRIIFNELIGTPIEKTVTRDGVPTNFAYLECPTVITLGDIGKALKSASGRTCYHCRTEENRAKESSRKWWQIFGGRKS